MSCAGICDLETLANEKLLKKILCLWGDKFPPGFREFLSDDSRRRDSLVNQNWLTLDVSKKHELFKKLLERCKSTGMNSAPLDKWLQEVPKSYRLFECCIADENKLKQKLGSSSLHGPDGMHSQCVHYEVEILRLEEDLEKWKNDQRVAQITVEHKATSFSVDVDLNKKLCVITTKAQEISSKLYGILEKAYQKDQSESHPETKIKYRSVIDHAISCICKLSEVCFIVTIQPDQVPKQSNMFGMTVSLLAGWNSGLRDINVEEVHCQICTETQLADRDQSKPPHQTGDSLSVQWKEITITHHDRHVVMHGAKRPAKRAAKSEGSSVAQQFPNVWHADFVSAQWIKSTDQKRGNNVYDLKYALVFTAVLPIKARQSATGTTVIKNCNLRCLSLPLVCVVHTNERPQARGTIFWYNSFGTLPKEQEGKTDKLFNEPESVKWSDFLPKLELWFETQNCMRPDQLNSFRRLIELNLLGDESVSDAVVNRNRFLVASTTKFRNSSLWCWLYACKKFLVESKDPFVSFIWQKQLVHFMTQEEAVERLKQFAQPEDILVIRLCNHRGGSIAITQSNGNGTGMDCIGPWEAKDLCSTSLDKRLDGPCGRSFILQLSGNLVRLDVLLKSFRESLKTNTQDHQDVPGYYSKTMMSCVRTTPSIAEQTQNSCDCSKLRCGNCSSFDLAVSSESQRENGMKDSSQDPFMCGISDSMTVLDLAHQLPSTLNRVTSIDSFLAE